MTRPTSADRSRVKAVYLSPNAGFHFVNQISWDGIIQLLAALSAVGAVLVALHIARADRDERTAERRAQHAAEARLFLVRGTGHQDAQADGRWTPAHPARLLFYVENRGPHPVVDVWYEAWFGTIADAPAQLRDEVVLPDGDDVAAGHRPPVAMDLPPSSGGLAAWRVRWTDRYGNQWVMHEGNRSGQPDRFDPEGRVVPYG